MKREPRHFAAFLGTRGMLFETAKDSPSIACRTAFRLLLPIRFGNWFFAA
jgi:hypothetical protein